MQLILPESHREPRNKIVSHSLVEYLVRVLTRASLGPLNDPFTIEFTKAISQWALLIENIFSCSSQCCFYFFYFLVIFYCYFLTLTKSWLFVLNLCLFSFFHSFYFYFHFYRSILLYLKVQSSKLYNKYMIASTKITNNDIFAFIAVLVFKLLSHKVLFIKRKDNRNC